MIRLYCFLIGYFIGMISFSYILGRIKGVDIRKKGSGNLGATNTMRALGKKAGVMVMLLDFAKMVAAVLVVSLLFADAYANSKFLLQTYTLAGCIMGHDFPFYLKFKGGKGCACLGGFIIFLHPIIAMVLIWPYILVFCITHYMSVCTISLYITFGVTVVILGQKGMWGLESSQLIEVYVIYLLLLLITILKHISNIKRIINGQENKTYLTKQVKKE